MTFGKRKKSLHGKPLWKKKLKKRKSVMEVWAWDLVIRLENHYKLDVDTQDSLRMLRKYLERGRR